MKLQPKIKLVDRVRQAIRLKNYSYSTEKAYVYGVKRFILFHNKRHPETMGGPEIEKFLSYLAVERNVSASTQNQALCALLFLYRDVLGSVRSTTGSRSTSSETISRCFISPEGAPKAERIFSNSARAPFSVKAV